MIDDTKGLRAEIIASEKARADFQKWKLILVAGLGAAALGITRDPRSQHIFLLCFIPPVCWYVDLMCAHLTLRILVIGTFLRQSAAIEYRAEPHGSRSKYLSYEEFAEKARTEISPFSLENIVMYGSSLLLYLLVALSGWILDQQWKWAYVISGIVGIVFTAMAYGRGEMKAYQMKTMTVERQP